MISCGVGGLGSCVHFCMASTLLQFHKKQACKRITTPANFLPQQMMQVLQRKQGLSPLMDFHIQLKRAAIAVYYTSFWSNFNSPLCKQFHFTQKMCSDFKLLSQFWLGKRISVFLFTRSLRQLAAPTWGGIKSARTLQWSLDPNGSSPPFGWPLRPLWGWILHQKWQI